MHYARARMRFLFHSSLMPRIPMLQWRMRRFTIACLVLALLLLFLYRVTIDLRNTNLRKTCPEFIEDEIDVTDGSDSAVLKAFAAPALLKNTKNPRARYNFLLVPSIQISAPGKRVLKGLRTSVIIVKSACGNKDRRDAIRVTWGSQNRYGTWRFVVVFLIGRPLPGKDSAMEQIQAEHEKYKDILMLDVNDTAEHVPDKTLAGMQWVDDFLPRSWIYSSADDDMSLHVPNFVRYLEDTISKRSRCIQEEYELRTLNLPIMCMYSYQSKDPPARNPQSKWYMSKERYPPDFWPPYCRGGWYSMPVYIAGKLYEFSRWMEYLYLDDVWITGLMRLKYVAAVKREKSMDTLLDAAPLSLRTDTELSENLKEPVSQVIVSHAWGNIEGRKVRVAEKLKENWKLWSSSFSASEIQAL